MKSCWASGNLPTLIIKLGADCGEFSFSRGCHTPQPSEQEARRIPRSVWIFGEEMNVSIAVENRTTFEVGFWIRIKFV
jgi:hypothetical protein